MNLDDIYPSRENRISVQLTDSENKPIDLTEQTVHLSIFSGTNEIIHVSQNQHFSASNGKTNIFINETQSNLLTPGVFYRWELSRVDGNGDVWGIDNGIVKVSDFRGSVS